MGEYSEQLLGDPDERFDIIETALPEDTNLSPQEFTQLAKRLRYGAVSAPKEAGEGDTFNLLFGLAVSRFDNVAAPEPSKPFLEFTPGQEVLARTFEASRAEATMRRLGQIEGDREALRDFADRYPHIADRVIGEPVDSWLDKVYNRAFKVARGGWRALDVVFRNFDRGRGAISSYMLAKTRGSSDETAIRKAKAALLGSSKGWRWVPEQQAVSFKEVLRAAGVSDDEASLSILGLGMDILVDPIWLFGVGASRKAIEIGAHQLLNSAGREVHGKLIRRSLDDMVRSAGVKDELNLSVEQLQDAWRGANTRMSQIVNQSKEHADQYLDKGGLKFAGYTLSGTSFLRRVERLREGRLEHDWVTETQARGLGRKSIVGLEKLGRATLKSRLPMSRKVGEFLTTLPTRLQTATKSLGLLFFRTSPSAGKEYRWYKQAEYLDQLGHEKMKVTHRISQIFEDIPTEHLDGMTFAIEDNAVAKYVQDVARGHGPEMAGKVQRAFDAYSDLMTEVIVDEVQRGWFKRKWSPTTKALFLKWASDPTSVEVPDRLLSMFRNIKIDYYVPHVYHNVDKARKLSPPPSTPRAPSITEVFTKRREIPSLTDARMQGLMPETNLKVLATIRANAWRRAATTQDFLEGVATKFGDISSLNKMQQKLISDAGYPLPHTTWGEVMKMRTDATGHIPLPTSEQIDLAKRMAYESLTPVDAVAKLDDEAKAMFLMYRLRNVNNSKVARTFWKKYVEDPTRQGLYDGMKVAPAKTLTEAYPIAKDFGDPFYPQWRFLEAGGLADPDILGRVLLPVPIVEDLERIRGNVLPEEMRRVLSLYDRLNYWWKRSVTIVWPAFHVRNKITNVVNSAMDIGIGGILDRGALYGVMQGGDGVLTTPAARYSYSQVRQLARRLGVVNLDYRRIDVSAEALADIVRRQTEGLSGFARKHSLPLPGRDELIKRGEELGPTSIALMSPFEAGRDVGVLIENGDKMQLFIKSLQRGFSPEQAARRVHQFLFDYGDIGKIDREFIRRFFNPFWTWTRKNIALQARMAANRPARWLTPHKFAQALSAEPPNEMRSQVERDFLPRYLSDQFGIRMSTANGWSKWLMNIDMPHEDLNRLYQGSLRKTYRDWISSIGPFARDFLEYGMEYDFFSGQREFRFIRGTKMYDMARKMPQPLKDWLGMHEEYWREQEVLRVDPAKWRQLNWMTGWMLTRLYSTFGRVTDPKAGTTSERLFNMFTGMRVEYIRPEDEIREMSDRIIKDKDAGLSAQLQRKWHNALNAYALELFDVGMAYRDMERTREAALTPEFPAELDEFPGSSWVEEEGL